MTTTIRLAGAELPRIGLGTNRLTDTPENRTFLHEALAAGVRHIDTAHLYTSGESERTIGATLADVPDDVLIATKGGYRDGRPDALRAEIEQSLRSLQTDSIGLYYLHRIDAEIPFEDSLGTIREYVDRGAIRHVGISKVGIAEIERARKVVPIAAVQNGYSLGDRAHDDVVDFCAAEGIAFVPYYPLHGGDGPALAEIADRHGATPDQVKLAWLLRRSEAIAPIPGTRSLEHLRENLAALELQLDDAMVRSFA